MNRPGEDVRLAATWLMESTPHNLYATPNSTAASTAGCAPPQPTVTAQWSPRSGDLVVFPPPPKASARLAEARRIISSAREGGWAAGDARVPPHTSHQVTLRVAGASEARRTGASELPEDGSSSSNTPSCLSSVIPNRCVERPRRSL